MKLLETSSLVAYEQGDTAAKRYVESHRHEPLTASTISMFELAFGVVRSNARGLDELVESQVWVDVLAVSVGDHRGGTDRLGTSGRGYAHPGRRYPDRRGRPDPGATLVADDQPFEAVDGLAVDAHRS